MSVNENPVSSGLDFNPRPAAIGAPQQATGILFVLVVGVVIALLG